MPDLEQVRLLRAGVEIWNEWRRQNPSAKIDLRGAELSRAQLSGAHLSKADLLKANLSEARLVKADLSEASLKGANLRNADLSEARLMVANIGKAFLDEALLSKSFLHGADLHGASLIEADLIETDLRRTDFTWAVLSRADLSRANLEGADLSRANLTGTNLTQANLSFANLSFANLAHATLDRCDIYGISSWNVRLEEATQTNLRITPMSEPDITVDNLEVAQFLYLLLNNENARAVLDTITSKVALILGRFSVDRKPILDAIREALRTQPGGYIPVLFDFDPQIEKPILETVKLLANLARFVIADLTDANMVRSELTYITANLPTVPVQPLLQEGASLPTEYSTWVTYHSFLQVHKYADLASLLASFSERVIEPVEGYVVARHL